MKQNLLFIMTDQMRLDALGVVSSWMKTPNLDRLAGEGINFTSCYTNAPVCVPARFSLATGETPYKLGLQGNVRVDLNPHSDIWTKSIQNFGYQTAVFGKTHLHRHEGDLRDREHLVNAYGFDTVDEIGGPRASAKVSSNLTDFWHREGYLEAYKQDMESRLKSNSVYAKPSVLPLELYADYYVGQKAKGYLDNVKSDKPWFCWVSFGGPHEPWDAPEPYASMYENVELPQPVQSLHGNDERLPRDCTFNRRLGISPELNDQQKKEIRENYAGNVSLIDEQVGELLATLEDRGILDQTIIVFTSDHGEMNGDHDLIYKEVLLNPTVKVPLIVSTPETRKSSVQQGERVETDSLVQLSDLGPTMLELIGCKPLIANFSESFGQLVKEPRRKHKGRRAVFSEVTDELMVATKRWKLIFDKNQQPYMLFDLKNDPHETINLVAKLRYRLVVAKLSKLMVNYYDFS